MKKLFRLFFAALTVVVCVAVFVHADFAKTAAYTEGMFTDVPTTEWFADSVKNAYEYGIMIGDSVSTFNPLGTLTVAEGVTIAARINENLTGAAIPAAADGEWYQRYVDYAVANGLMSAGKFADYDRNIKRSEIAELLAVVAGDLPAINNVSVLPDVPDGMPYTAAVLKLYNAGILTGNDDYGTFAPDSNLLRSEISAMAVRIADSAKRVKKDFLSAGARTYGDAYAIIETVNGSGRNGIANGWNYDNRFELFNDNGADKNYVVDTDNKMFSSLIRDFAPESEGVFNLDMFVNVFSKDGGVYIAFENAAEERLFGLKEVGGKWVVFGSDEVVSNIDVFEAKTTNYEITFRFDLDQNTFTTIIDNKLAGTVAIPADITVQRLVLGTNKIGTGYIKFTMCKLNKNYIVADRFLVQPKSYGEEPYGYDVTGNFKLAEIQSELVDVSSVKSETSGGSVSTARRSFAPVNGVVDIETFILLPEKVDGASFAVTSAGNEILKIETKNGKLVIGDTELRDYTANVWHNLHIEADTAAGKALIKINGKDITTVDFNASFFDGAVYSFAPTTNAVMWFDDLDIYCLVEHDDYPAYPQSAQDDSYNIGINFCWLWRDSQSNEGWDSISPFPEFDPYLGYYDEGSRELADWEIKYLAEHGVDFINACWYAPYSNATAPIKRERVSYAAMHDGYMNAKYADIVKFSIMWENDHKDAVDFETFKEYLWKYWMEYYFTDPRYARLDNKAVLTVWNRQQMLSTFGGTADSAIQCVQWMENQLKAIGYDGLILLFPSQGSITSDTFNALNSWGATGMYAYSWGTNGYRENYQTERNAALIQYALSTGSHFVPTVSIGFNDVGRNETRDPIISEEDHLSVCRTLKTMLGRYRTGTWKDKTVMVSTWNEFSEGTYVMPTSNIGFSYLENIRKTFTNDTSDHSALDVKPTQAQIDRVGHMYPPHHSPIRWWQLEGQNDASLNETDSVQLQAYRSYDMKTAKGLAAFERGHGLDSYKEGGGVISGSASGIDYSITSTDSDFKPFAASVAYVMHVRMKTSTASGEGEFFFKTESDPNYSGAKAKRFDLTKSNEYVDYYVDMSANGSWTGTITGIRFDPCTAPGTFEISLIEAMGKPEDIPGVIVNGGELDFTFEPIEVGNDIEVVGEARGKGFYSRMRVYHEWDRFTGDGVLTLKTRDEKTVVFTVGSDKATVDGVPVDLGYTFRIRDGLPVFRIKKLCDILGYSYTEQGKKIQVRAATDEEYEQLLNREEEQWEFNVPGELDGWQAMGSTHEVNVGALTITPTNTDPMMIHEVNFQASKYTHLIVGVKYAEIMRTATPQFFFTTSASNSFTGDKRLDGKYNLEGKQEGDTVDVIFDLSKNSAFGGTITSIRFDPHAALDVVSIDYVRFVHDESLRESTAKMLLVEDENQYEFDKDGDTMGWNSWGTKGLTTKDGYLVGTSINVDPCIRHKGNFYAEGYQAIVIGIRYLPQMKDFTPQLFFTTEKDPDWTADKCVNSSYKLPENVKEGDIVEVTFNLSFQDKWKGVIDEIRFDMFAEPDLTYEIDYVRFFREEGVEAPSAPPTREEVPAEKLTEVVINAGEPIPKGVTVTPDCARLAVADDPKGGKCWNVIGNPNAQYVYFNVSMNFVPGALYSIEYKLMPTKDINGNDYPKTVIGGNFRFCDTVDGGIKNHTFNTAADKASSTEWIAVSEEYRIPADYKPTADDGFQIWGRSVESGSISYLVKDVSITIKK